MRKQHGPDFKKQVQPTVQCPACFGAGTYVGITGYEWECPSCLAAGAVLASDGSPIPEGEVVLTLARKIRDLRNEIATLQRTQPTQENNRRGAGFSHYTGD